MKRERLLRHLRRHGCVIRREGTEHSLWENPRTGHAEAVPRHVEIANLLARRISECCRFRNHRAEGICTTLYVRCYDGEVLGDDKYLSMTDPASASRTEGVKLLPVWIAIGLPVSFILLAATPLGDFFWFYVAFLCAPAGWGLVVVLLLFPWECAGTWATIRAVQCLGRRAWWQALVNITLPLVVLGVELHFTPFVHFSNDAGDVVYWLALRPAYMREIRATPNTEPRLLEFNRGGMIWASRGFVYDERDQVLLPPSSQSAAWKAAAQGTDLSCEGYYAQPFPGRFAFTQHWYLASFPC